MMIKRHDIPRAARGFSLIELMIVIAIIGILVGVGVPAWRNAVVAGNEAAAIQNLRNIATEQRTYFISHGRTNYGTFEQLELGNRFKGDAPIVEGYIYTMKLTPRSQNQQAAFSVNADPQQKEGLTATGKRHFYIGTDVANITTSTDGPASAASSSEGGGDAPAADAPKQ